MHRMRNGGAVAGRRGVLCALMLLAWPSMLAGQESPAGAYRLAGGGPDVASGLVLRADGSFEYFLAAGALDEHASGRWTVEGTTLRLTTVPRPVPAVFSAGPVERSGEAALVLHVTGPDGGGIAGVDLTVGFDAGEDVEGYTQEDGWTLPEGEARAPRWVELGVAMHRLRSRRFPLDPARGNAFTFVLTPNDLGEVDFTGMPAEVMPGRVVVHRGGAEMVFVVEEGRGR